MGYFKPAERLRGWGSEYYTWLYGSRWVRPKSAESSEDDLSQFELRSRHLSAESGEKLETYDGRPTENHLSPDKYGNEGRSSEGSSDTQKRRSSEIYALIRTTVASETARSGLAIPYRDTEIDLLAEAWERFRESNPSADYGKPATLHAFIAGALAYRDGIMYREWFGSFRGIGGPIPHRYRTVAIETGHHIFSRNEPSTRYLKSAEDPGFAGQPTFEIQHNQTEPQSDEQPTGTEPETMEE